MTDTDTILQTARSVLVVDWPMKDLPETLVRAGYAELLAAVRAIRTGTPVRRGGGDRGLAPVSPPAGGAGLDIRPLPGRSLDLAALLEEGGDPKWCWCRRRVGKAQARS
jgi:hypothetical protein